MRSHNNEIERWGTMARMTYLLLTRLTFLQVKKHEFFDGIDWQKLMALELAPPFEPDLDEEAPSPQQHARHNNAPATTRRRSHRASP